MLEKTVRTRKTRTSPPVMPMPAHTDIANRAYELFLERGCQHGQDWDDWLTAERELALFASKMERETGGEVARPAVERTRKRANGAGRSR